MYFLDPNDNHTLYGNNTARSPLPAGLFTEQPAGLGAPIGATKKWTPRVRLVDAKLYRAAVLGGLDDLKDDYEVSYHALTVHKIKKGSDLDHQSYSEAIGNKLHETLASDYIPTLKRALHLQTDFAVVSPNDCARFASVLQHLIGTESRVFSRRTSTAVVQSRTACFHRSLEVADTVILKFPNGGRHGITAVAVSRGFGPADQVVTLEAHASRYLTIPQFHIYRAGTMDDLLMTWYGIDTIGNPKSTTSFLTGRPSYGELNVSTTKPDMLTAGELLVELVGRTYRGGPKTNRAIWNLIGCAAAVPCLISV